MHKEECTVSQGPSCRRDLIKAKATEFECDVKCASVIKIDTKCLIKCPLLC